jgi:hypothetical protein
MCDGTSPPDPACGLDSMAAQMADVVGQRRLVVGLAPGGDDHVPGALQEGGSPRTGREPPRRRPSSRRALPRSPPEGRSGNGRRTAAVPHDRLEEVTLDDAVLFAFGRPLHEYHESVCRSGLPRAGLIQIKGGRGRRP